jgi:hypothetical protein
MNVNYVSKINELNECLFAKYPFLFLYAAWNDLDIIMNILNKGKRYGISIELLGKLITGYGYGRKTKHLIVKCSSKMSIDVPLHIQRMLNMEVA